MFDTATWQACFRLALLLEPGAEEIVQLKNVSLLSILIFNRANAVLENTEVLILAPVDI